MQSASVDEDIRTYLRTRLPDTILDRSDLNIPESASWLDEKDVEVLVRKSNGLFIFAATICRFFKSDDDDPRKLLQQVVNLADSTIREGLVGFDTFYTTTATGNRSSNWNNMQAIDQRQTVLGAITTTFNPPSPSALAKLLGLSTDNIRTSLRHLHSVILVPESDSEPTKIYHKSFSDYLTDPDRCKDTGFYIDVGVHHGRMAAGCLKLMVKELKKNICDLPQYAMNQEVEDLPARSERYISNELEYSCRFWARHLNSDSGAGGDIELTTKLLRTFFETHLMSWLEVLSITGEMRAAVYSIAFLKEWLAKVSSIDFVSM